MIACLLAVAATTSAQILVLSPERDNTLYDVPGGGVSNGAGEHLHTGRNGGGAARRAVLAFDLSAIPSGATVISAQLTMNLSRTRDGAMRATTLHRLLEDWGEAGSNSDRGEGGGAPAQNGDATWLHRFFPDQLWDSPGGTFVAAPSATAQIGGPGPYVWDSTAQLVADVQAWVDEPTSNFGWIVIGDENSGPTTSNRFDSKDNAIQGSRPRLTLSYSTSQAPAASFEWSPAQPAVDQEIEFTDTSSGGPTTWAWDFGDSATSSERNPRHSYASAGDYTVSLTVSNAQGSDEVSQVVTVTEGGPDLTELVFVPAAANAAGVGTSFFVTDLDVNNAGAATLTYRFLWLPRNTDNGVPEQSALFTIEPGVSVRYENVLADVFGLSEVVGALAIASDGDGLRAMSRTFNQSDSGTYGQSLPGVAAADLVAAGQRVRVLFMTENAAFRSNLGLLNGVDNPIAVRWELFAADGSSLRTGETALGAWGNTQLNRVFGDFAPIEAAYADVWTETAGATFTCYGSVLDAATSDPTTVLPQ
jgi:PKD repeat protein